MIRLIAAAYGVKEDKVVGGPKWVDVDQFDVIAKAAEASTQAQLQSMLQALLADRFQLKVRKEERPYPIYTLTVAKRGLSLKPSGPQASGDCKRANDNGFATYTCSGVSMASLAERLPGTAPGYFNHSVVDRTGATGNYDFTLRWTGRGMLGANPDTVSLFDYMEKQLGIKVEPSTMPMLSVVVESVNETPADNPPGTKEALPPAPAEFEVADIKLNKGGDPRMNFALNHGRLDIAGVSLRVLIQVSFGVEDDGMLAGGEKWLDTDRYDLVAKTDPTVDFEELRPMMQKLLEERFKLVTHKEDQPVTVYTLAALKGAKLQDGDPSARSACVLTVDNGIRTYACSNTTMAEFVDKLPNFAAGYLDHPLVDMTGLKGAYNFAVGWSPLNRTRAGGGRGGQAAAGATAAEANAASDPTGGFTLAEGLAKLGFKLTQQKHPMPVLVIDKMQRTPTEN